MKGAGEQPAKWMVRTSCSDKQRYIFTHTRYRNLELLALKVMFLNPSFNKVFCDLTDLEEYGFLSGIASFKEVKKCKQI
jgi:hypothetical protein